MVALSQQIRVRVRSGDGTKDLGKGTYVGDVDVYYATKDGVLLSLQNAEAPPMPGDLPAGAVVRKSHGNPKIILDTGEVVYGCQVG